MQDITEHLSDIEMELSELGRKLEDVRQQIRDMSVVVKPKPDVKVQGNHQPASSVNKRTGRGTYAYGSSYRPDRWINQSAPVSATTNGIQETWSVGDEIGSPYAYTMQNDLNIANSYPNARQSEYSIHARP